jgi:hypothetical protein
MKNSGQKAPIEKANVMSNKKLKGNLIDWGEEVQIFRMLSQN